MVRVKDLIKQLQKLDPEKQIVIYDENREQEETVFYLEEDKGKIRIII